MRKLLLVVPGVLLLIAACRHKGGLPKDILEPEKMEAVAYDVMRTTEFLSSYVFPRDSTINKLAESRIWYDKVFQLHKVTREQFENSYTYYKAHPEMMRTIMDSIGTKQTSSVPAMIETTPPPVADTIKAPDTAKKIVPPPLVDTLAMKKKMQDAMDTVRKRRLRKAIR